MARIVINHSTFLEGLMKVLTRFSASDRIKTIIPGPIKHTGRLGAKDGGLVLRIAGGGESDVAPSHLPPPHSTGNSVSQKIIASHQSTIQDVFVVYDGKEFASKEDLAQHLRSLLKKERCTIVVPGPKEAPMAKAKPVSPEKFGGKSMTEKKLGTNFHWQI